MHSPIQTQNTQASQLQHYDIDQGPSPQQEPAFRVHINNPLAPHVIDLTPLLLPKAPQLGIPSIQLSNNEILAASVHSNDYAALYALTLPTQTRTIHELLTQGSDPKALEGALRLIELGVIPLTTRTAHGEVDWASLFIGTNPVIQAPRQDSAGVVFSLLSRLKTAQE